MGFFRRDLGFALLGIAVAALPPTALAQRPTGVPDAGFDDGPYEGEPGYDSYAAAYRAYHQRLYDRAIADFGKAIRRNRSQPWYWLGRGKAYAGKKEYDKAIADFSEVIRLDPDTFGLAYRLRAEAWDNKQEYERSFDDCQRALAINPNNYEAYYFRARAKAYGRGDQIEALLDYEKALQGTLRARVYYHRANSWIRLLKFDKAMEDYDQMAKLVPTNYRAFLQRGKMHLLHYKDPASAIAELTFAIKYKPDEALAYKLRGDAWDQTGSEANARKDYQAAAGLDPKIAKQLKDEGRYP